MTCQLIQSFLYFCRFDPTPVSMHSIETAFKEPAWMLNVGHLQWTFIPFSPYLGLRSSSRIRTGPKINATKQTLCNMTWTLQHTQRSLLEFHPDSDLCFPLNLPQTRQKNYLLLMHCCCLLHSCTRFNWVIFWDDGNRNVPTDQHGHFSPLSCAGK